MAQSSRSPAPLSAAEPQAAPGPSAPWGWTPARASLAAWPVTLLGLEGPDSLRFLHGQSSQAIALAKPGQWLSTCCITATARMRALAEVLVTANGAWLVISAGDGASVREALDRVLFPADAVTLGPLRSGQLLEPLPAPPGGDGERQWHPLEGGEGFWLGEQLLLLNDAAQTELEPAAQELLLLPRLSPGEQERWRLQQGRPAVPAELNDGTNPFELGLAGRVSLNKGCYVGQETLARLATYDGVKQQLRRWFCDGAAAPSVGSTLTLAGERAGSITSVLPLPEDQGWIGLALVRRQILAERVLRLGAPNDPGEVPGAMPETQPESGTVELSVPAEFVAPPLTGSGHQG